LLCLLLVELELVDASAIVGISRVVVVVISVPTTIMAGYANSAF
jgi:hypothetical protein